MTVTVETPFVDVRGDTLRWALGLAAKPALAVREVPLGDGRTLELRVLGASHQVLVRRGEELLLSETVACDLAGAAALPARADVTGYRFGSTIDRPGPGGFAGAVGDLVGRLADDPRAIVAEFPGLPYAVTALAARTTDTLGWDTWHCYPQTGELVRTSTLLHPEEGSDVHQI